MSHDALNPDQFGKPFLPSERDVNDLRRKSTYPQGSDTVARKEFPDKNQAFERLIRSAPLGAARRTAWFHIDHGDGITLDDKVFKAQSTRHLN